ncbi:MAG: hypothetical protein ACYTBJ_24290 [Planctomycetota bacterium]|jgi:hypothetical protein
MFFWLCVIIGLVVAGLVVSRWSRRHLVRVHKEICGIRVSQISPLAQECIAVFGDKLEAGLNVDEAEESLIKIEEAVFEFRQLQEAFARDGFKYYFVKPVGAFLGELVRIHRQAEWVEEAGCAPYLMLRDDNIHPFEAAIGFVATGKIGGIWLNLRTMLELTDA